MDEALLTPSSHRVVNQNGVMKEGKQLRNLVIFGLCLFIALLSFKPSEPYLTEYLLCYYDTQQDYCSRYSDDDSCNGHVPCLWSEMSCRLLPCNNVTLSDCGDDDYNYCYEHSGSCKQSSCYQHFTEEEVNNEIYPWSTYAYLPFLLLLGPLAELVSYRVSILFGILGRVATRILLLFGRNLLEMQIMQVTYALGTAAEDVFGAYIYYVVEMEYYQSATSYVKTAALLSALVSGVLGDFLVVFFDVSLTTLMWISAGFVWAGFAVGFLVIKASHKSRKLVKPITPHNVKSNIDPFQEEEDSYLRFLMPEFLFGSKPASTPSSNDEHRTVGATQEELEGEEEEPVDPFVNNPFVHRQSMQGRNLSNETKFSSSRSFRKHQRSKRRRRVFNEKIRLFNYQLLQLYHAMQFSGIMSIVLLWVVGNAVYMILYNYEVSIYQELNGSNTWNGSVLAIMLIAGSFGAMLPTWIHRPVVHSTASFSFTEPTAAATAAATAAPNGYFSASFNQTLSDSDAIVAVRLIVAGALSCVSLFLFITAWSLYYSIAFLSIFFATWQYMNVIIYVRLASHLKILQMESQLLKHLPAPALQQGILQEGKRFGSEGSASYNYSCLSGDDEQMRVDEEEEMRKQQASSLIPSDPSTNIGNDQGEEMLQTQKCSLSSSSYRPSSSSGGTLGPSDAVHPAFLDQKSTQPAILSIAPNSRSLAETQGLPSVSPLPFKKIVKNLEVDPPYSVAFVTIVAANVLVQIIIQSIVFSWLQFDLRMACGVAIVVFFGAMVVFSLFCLISHGVSGLFVALWKDGRSTISHCLLLPCYR